VCFDSSIHSIHSTPLLSKLVPLVLDLLSTTEHPSKMPAFPILSREILLQGIYSCSSKESGRLSHRIIGSSTAEPPQRHTLRSLSRCYRGKARRALPIGSYLLCISFYVNPRNLPCGATFRNASGRTDHSRDLRQADGVSDLWE